MRLEESAYIDGSGVVSTFLRIIIPISIPMMITIFLFAFSWQWTDNFYVNLFFTSSGPKLLPDVVAIPKSLYIKDFAAQTTYEAAIRNTCGLVINCSAGNCLPVLSEIPYSRYRAFGNCRLIVPVYCGQNRI